MTLIAANAVQQSQMPGITRIAVLTVLAAGLVFAMTDTSAAGNRSTLQDRQIRPNVPIITGKVPNPNVPGNQQSGGGTTGAGGSSSGTTVSHHRRHGVVVRIGRPWRWRRHCHKHFQPRFGYRRYHCHPRGYHHAAIVAGPAVVVRPAIVVRPRRVVVRRAVVVAPRRFVRRHHRRWHRRHVRRWRRRH